MLSWNIWTSAAVYQRCIKVMIICDSMESFALETLNEKTKQQQKREKKKKLGLKIKINEMTAQPWKGQCCWVSL